MSSSEKPCTSTQFVRTDVIADPINAATVRREFSDWLRLHFTLDATKTSDVVLAVNEAMANAAEFAYVTLEKPGTMRVQADYDGSAATLTVTVTDEGAWRRAESGMPQLKRGRGIPLMHALADRATVDSSQAGTRVCLEWTHVAAPTGVGDQARLGLR
jgi:anti-sigma regulatory factor (Ser/Thr protein kinase)